ncbi:uncharacterized protein MONBRDRAFT_25541 [Monosiga brevicollis MX1]|uniref:RING-type E3 ubiquitin transferase n=1 Tax=Monosiga brevicollis TaxID=81824 RepID=A9UZQ3_MONBE|nr:uncharacterized protein MONBRDRAFT_25541 [Monosiga brevicollis MX1]EDQ89408.1 predicted protein [Monosiga brevicollis MX1]|eukprot:XP_001745984.1 hypothetical protein [Monosiga brevicollis MX1]
MACVPPEQLVGPLDANFSCPVCLDCIREPIMCTRCQCLFGECCWLQAMDAQNACPHCRQSPAVGVPLRPFKNILAQLPTRCAHPGCQAQTRLEDLHQHEAACPFNMVACPACAQVVRAPDLAQHVNACSFHLAPGLVLVATQGQPLGMAVQTLGRDVFVGEVFDGSLAAQAGLVEGHQILQINNEPIESWGHGQLVMALKSELILLLQVEIPLQVQPSHVTLWSTDSSPHRLWRGPDAAPVSPENELATRLRRGLRAPRLNQRQLAMGVMSPSFAPSWDSGIVEELNVDWPDLDSESTSPPTIDHVAEDSPNRYIPTLQRDLVVVEVDGQPCRSLEAALSYLAPHLHAPSTCVVRLVHKFDVVNYLRATSEVN